MTHVIPSIGTLFNFARSHSRLEMLIEIGEFLIQHRDILSLNFGKLTIVIGTRHVSGFFMSVKRGIIHIHAMTNIFKPVIVVGLDCFKLILV